MEYGEGSEVEQLWEVALGGSSSPCQEHSQPQLRGAAAFPLQGLCLGGSASPKPGVVSALCLWVSRAAPRTPPPPLGNQQGLAPGFCLHRHFWFPILGPLGEFVNLKCWASLF